jgi:hypothetical protein
MNPRTIAICSASKVRVPLPMNLWVCNWRNFNVMQRGDFKGEKKGFVARPAWVCERAETLS